MFRQFTFLLFFIPLISFGQLKDRSLYFQEINKAELSLVEENYEKAFSHYSKAFSFHKNPFLRDLYNATVCKFFLKDFDGAKVLLFKLARRGVKKEALEERNIFEISGFGNEWKEFSPFYDQFFEEKEESEYEGYLGRNLQNLINNFYKLSYDDFKFLNSINESESDKAIRIRDSYAYEFSGKKDTIRIFSRKEVEEERIILKKLLLDNLDEIKSILKLIFEQNNYLAEDELDLVSNISNIASFKLLQRFDSGNSYLLSETKPVVEEIEKLFSDEILASFNQGKIGQFVALRDMGDLKAISKISVRFYEIKIENTENCDDGFDDLSNINFYKENTISEEYKSNYKRLREKLLLESIEDRIKKEVFMVTKNQYFLIPYFSQKELSTVPNCDIARQMIVGATVIR
ncbi:MAG: hypothetical protein IPH28_14345 [Cytophagaceae bacterium]|nr:hypothetical protein [Cytophagaceae bacterium]MBK9934368.1 hypothetical protein [Cytophagaceae bacterium]MBL0300816.1 hypothetical protein [Cytophagaceae bacterium]MBL0327759.1 hypothetical protein [Cytophagaceae bacterium]